MLDNHKLVSLMAKLAAENLKEFSISILDIEQSPEKVIGIGIETLDSETAEWSGGELIALASREREINAALVLSVLASNIQSTQNMLYFCTEATSEEEIVESLLSDLSGVSKEDMQNALLTDDQWNALCKAYALLLHSKLDILHYPRLSPCLIREILCDIGPSVVLIDNLRRMHADEAEGWERRRDEYMRIVFDLKEIAKAYDSPIAFALRLDPLLPQQRHKQQIKPSLRDFRAFASERDCNHVYLAHRNTDGAIEVSLVRIRFGGPEVHALLQHGTEDPLQKVVWNKSRIIYGDPLPDLVKERLQKELSCIFKNDYTALYNMAFALAQDSEKHGYAVSSRGVVSASLVAFLAGITEINPLPPHYICTKCHYFAFFTQGEVGSGFDLPNKNCPICGRALHKDGHDIPIETFLGFDKGNGSDIILQISDEYQHRAQAYLNTFLDDGTRDFMLKPNILTYDVLTIYRYLEAYTGILIENVPTNAPEVYSLLTSPKALDVTSKEIECETGTLSLPGLSTEYGRLLLKTQPKNFSDLVKTFALSLHGMCVGENKAYAASLMLSAVRLGWYKIHFPVEYYAAYFTAHDDDLDIETLRQGAVRSKMDSYRTDQMHVAHEAMMRGIYFSRADQEKSHVCRFLPEEGGIRLPKKYI